MEDVEFLLKSYSLGLQQLKIRQAHVDEFSANVSSAIRAVDPDKRYHQKYQRGDSMFSAMVARQSSRGSCGELLNATNIKSFIDNAEFVAAD
jgi:hypothetical protein